MKEHDLVTWWGWRYLESRAPAVCDAMHSDDALERSTWFGRYGVILPRHTMYARTNLP